MDLQPPFRYIHFITVAAADIDAMSHANNVVYLRWVQETATAHWEAALPAAERAPFAYVVLEHRIRYHRPAFEHDVLKCSTWIEETTAATIQRFTRLEKAESGVLLAEAETLWCLLDARTNRPRRIEPELEAIFRKPVP